ncbi:hypothetical protein MJO28_004999 [Puccinia striiformis f. sp. tritici]|uniref:Uncharacterized protein n=1 Tax=Puccinia striiformis f. sp. tritici TaxID=168172 RepID=A0ACC0EJG6_9BASI|nr:hypothetical protein MJO28_004999 [Puccinia striiformis f. sp. tritici]
MEDTQEEQGTSRLTIQPGRIQLIKGKLGKKQETNQRILPFATSISKLLFKLLSHTHIQPQEPGLINRLTGYLSLLIIRELATLEDLFIDSPVYRILKFLTPSILPKSSTYPFLLTLILGGIQLKKLWKHQQQLLINLFISLAPLLNTLRVLSQIQIHHDRIQSQDQVEEDAADSSQNPHQELRRWTVYWIIYCSLINLESLKVWTTDSSHRSPITIRPTIYPSTIPSTQTQNHIPYLEKAFHLFRNLKTQSSQHLLNLLPNLIKPKLISETLTTIRPVMLPIESLDLHALPTTSNKFIQLFLPEYLFGEKRGIIFYGFLKVIFLRWCSSEQSKGSEWIWNQILAPILSVIGRSSRSHQRHMKVVKVTISSEQDQEPAPPPDATPPRRRHPDPATVPLPERSLTRPDPPENLQEARMEDSPTSWSVRRIKSDPTPARWEPTGRPAHALTEPADTDPHTEQTNASSSSPVPSSYPSSILEPLLDPSPLSLSKTSPHPHPPPKRANSLTKHQNHHPPTLDFKTPENAWDTLSFIG